MHISDLPDRSQDYLKTIWDITELLDDQPAALGDIAEKMNQKTPTASEAIKKLAARGLVNHEKYAGVTLTEQGKMLAIDMVRRHRLLETFLHDVLGYTWDEVHADADLLEHAASDQLIERIDAHLGRPRKDPHGDPIPTAEGVIEESPRTTLEAVQPGETVTISRVKDIDPELLRYLAQYNASPGCRITVASGPLAGMVHVVVEGTDTSFPLAETQLPLITVQD
ncbi:metal-dependent transcriptional regulator [Corynebacterium glutamicum]|uniref:metal-dependent transcriptional regulator n=1 Tax=Corynebacterium glutamicum TaxID=1718 RepID=UPI001C6F1CA9|nr:metal-dependent transcriptional regulator [Corynebacterium glutamicum]QYR18131.1 metal-dependent transcriptional regulator [Corynebacterium glutamicum]